MILLIDSVNKLIFNKRKEDPNGKSFFQKIDPKKRIQQKLHR